jgi:hypothetical protein
MQSALGLVLFVVSSSAMHSALGLVLFVVYIAAIVSLAAGITWVVVRLTPAKKPDTSPKT